MDYPATQMFVNDDDDQEDEEDDGTPLRPEKIVKVGELLVDSVTYPVFKGENKIGRIDTCSIVIDHNTISKEHAEIEAGVGSRSTFISDLGSLNKTKLNNTILHPQRLYQLHDGDVVRFGSVRAVFKLEKELAVSRNSDDFVVPETPAPVVKATCPIIPGTPDLSLNESRGSDVSLVQGTQDADRRSPRLSCGTSSQRTIARELRLDSGADETAEMSKQQDIFELETQKNFHIPDSDEENIFDMPTQPDNNHDDETQKFSNDNIHAVMLSKYTVNEAEAHSRSIEDLETQKFHKHDGENVIQSINDLETQKIPGADVGEHESRRSVDRIEPGHDSCDINDLETQKLEVSDCALQSRRSNIKPKSVSKSINELETQKFEINNVVSESRNVDDIAHPKSYSMNKPDIQRPGLNNEDDDDDDSETDEEGIFENRDGSVDMFNAPTQVIRAPCKALVENDSGENVAIGSKECKITQRGVAELEENEEGDKTAKKGNRESVKVVTLSKAQANNEEKKTALNDSIESKLNHMFDDVNESAVEEPTQILTQHLENILESTQVGESGSHKRTDDIPSAENIDLKLTTVANHMEDKIDESEDDDDDDVVASSDNDDDDVVASSDNEERRVSLMDTPKKARSAVIRMPEIISTQELFADLPAVDIFRTPRQGSIRVSPTSSGTVTPKSVKSYKSKSRSPETVENTDALNKEKKGPNSPKSKTNASKRTGLIKSVESVSSKRSKIAKGADAKDNQTPTKANYGRKEQRIQNTEERASPKVKGFAKDEESRKGLPLKKRGSSILSSPHTPKKIEPEVVLPNPRAATRSSMRISAETAKRSSRSSNLDSPKVPEPKQRATPKSTFEANHRKLESPSKPETSSPDNKIGKKPSESNNNSHNKKTIDVIPPTRRGRKKALETSTEVGDEEVSPAKRLRTTTLASPPNVNHRGRGRRINVVQNESANEKKANHKIIEDLSDAGHQSSLESQEIQAILGVADKQDGNAPERGGSRYRAKMRIFRSTEVATNSGNDKGLTGFSQTDVTEKKENSDGFEKPIGRPVRQTRNSQRVKTEVTVKKIEKDNNEDTTGPSKIPVQLRRGRTEAFGKDDSSKTTPTGGHAKKENVVKTMLKKLKNRCSFDNRPEEKRNSFVSEDEVKMEATQEAPKVQPTTPRRGKKGATQKTVGKEGSEKAVEENVGKRGRRINVGRLKLVRGNPALSSNNEVDVSQISNPSSNASPLRRGRSTLATPSSAAKATARSKHKILFTGLNDPELVSTVHNLGGTVTEKLNDCTALVTDKVRRTYKFLCGMAMAVPIVSIEWLKQSERKGRFLETGDFLLRDPVEEAKFKFDLRRSLARATGHKLLDGYTVVLTPNTAPPPITEMKGIIQACGGKPLVRPPSNRWPEKSLLISRQEDAKNAKKYLTKAPSSVKVLSVEFILTGILRHELNFDEHRLEID